MPTTPLSPRAKEMRTLLARYERGESTLAELAAEAGVKRSTLIWWRSRLRMLARSKTQAESLPSSSGPAFVEITHASDPSTPPLSPSSPDLIVELASIRVRVPQGFDTEELRRLIETLR